MSPWLPLPPLQTAPALTAVALGAFGLYACMALLMQALRAQREMAARWRVFAGLALGSTLWSVQAVVLPALPGLEVARWSLAAQGWAWVVATAISLVVCELAARSGSHRRAALLAALALLAGVGLVPVLGLLGAALPSTAMPAAREWTIGVAGALLAVALSSRLALIGARQRAGRRALFGIAASLAGSFGAVWCAAFSGSRLGTGSLERAGQLLRSADAAAGTVAGESLWLLSVVGVPALFFALMAGAGIDQRIRRILKAAESDLALASTRDPLTTLLNREALEARLHSMAARAEASHQGLGVLMVDVDGFRPVNEALGHAVGDALLRAFSERLAALAAPDDAVGRLNGDKFVLLVPQPSGSLAVIERAARLVERMQQPVVVQGREFSLSCSVGVALFPDHGAESVLIARAERATAAAKRSGGATHCVFEPHMVAPPRDQVDMVRDLRRAIEQGELELFYQPKVNAPTGEITGAEALMRWRHPLRGVVSPGVFIPVAERFGLIGMLGNWVIDEACRQARAWRDQGLRMRVAINLSVQQMRQEDIVDRIAEALRRHRVNPRLLTCEITESAAMDDTGSTKALFARLEALGVHISIDDFGTGYSSLAYLRQLPAEELKIDQSFVADLETSGDARAIVDAVVKLAQALGLKVVAEGVETEGQQRILRSLGCDQLQGYLFARPMSAKALALWAMDDVGPRALPFRNSLFSDTSTTDLDAAAPTRPAPLGTPPATAAPRAGDRSASR